MRPVSKPIANLEVGDESDIEPNAPPSPRYSNFRAPVHSAHGASPSPIPSLGPTSARRGVQAVPGTRQHAPQVSNFSAAAVLGQLGTKPVVGGVNSPTAAARSASKARAGGPGLGRESSSSSEVSYDGELPSSASISRMNSERQLNPGQLRQGVLSNTDAGLLAEISGLSFGESPLHRSPGVAAGGPGSPLRRQINGPGPPGIGAEGSWEDGPPAVASGYGRMSMSPVRAAGAVPQPGVVAASQGLLASMEAVTAARSDVKARIAQDLELLMAKRTAFHKKQPAPAMTAIAMLSDPKRGPALSQNSSAIPAPPSDMYQPTGRPMRRVSSTEGGGGAAGMAMGPSWDLAASSSSAQLEPGIGVTVNGYGGSQPASTAAAGSGNQSSQGGVLGSVAASRVQPGTKYGRGGQGRNGGIRKGGTIHKAVDLGISGWDTGDASDTNSPMADIAGFGVQAVGLGSVREPPQHAPWPPPRPAPAADPHRAAVENVFRASPPVPSWHGGLSPGAHGTVKRPSNSGGSSSGANTVPGGDASPSGGAVSARARHIAPEAAGRQAAFTQAMATAQGGSSAQVTPKQFPTDGGRQLSVGPSVQGLATRARSFK